MLLLVFEDDGAERDDRSGANTENHAQLQRPVNSVRPVGRNILADKRTDNGGHGLGGRSDFIVMLIFSEGSWIDEYQKVGWCISFYLPSFIRLI